MEDEAGNERVTTAAQLLDALGTVRPRLVFLSACLTAAPGEGDVNTGTDSLAAVLVGQANLPAVVGWDGSVADVAATAFARQFYERFGRGLSVVEAAAAARRCLIGEATHGPAAMSSASDAVLRRDWHLARVWLGTASPGGGAIGGTRKRSLLAPDAGRKRILARKHDAQLEVADPAMFVGRRREIQTALRVLAGSDHVGVLLHGMGRLGKSSLAARLADRRSDLRLAVVFGTYDALSVVEALESALAAHPAARKLLAKGRRAVLGEPEALYDLLVDLLAGPCATKDRGQPVLLLLDDLEQVLGLEFERAAGRDRSAERAAVRAVLRAFAAPSSESRLLITSRYPFSLVHADTDLSRLLHPIQVPEFTVADREKLMRRQADMAQARPVQSARLSQAALRERLPLLRRTEALAHANPGLQDLIGAKIVLDGAVPVNRAEEALGELEAYVDGGALPANESLRGFLENLHIDKLLHAAGEGGRALLQAAATIFDRPVPSVVLARLAEAVGSDPDRLRNLGLLDPSEDIVTQGEALAVNSLVATRLAKLSDTEADAMAQIAAVTLFSSWGGADAARIRPVSADITLTRLGVRAGNTEIVAHCAQWAVRALVRSGSVQEAVYIGRSAIKLLEDESREPSLMLLAATAEALEFAGDGREAMNVLEKGLERVADSNGVSERVGIDQFLFRLGLRQQTSGLLEEARRTFERLCGMARARADAHQLTVVRGQIADILVSQGEVEEALRIRREEELPILLRLGDANGIARAQFGIVELEFARGDFESAFPRLVESWIIVRRTGHADGIAVVGERLGRLLATNETTHQEAADILRHSRDAYRKLGREANAQRVEETLRDLPPE